LGILLLIAEIEGLLLLLNWMQLEKRIKRRNGKRMRKKNRRTDRRK